MQAALPAAPATVGSYLVDRAATRATATLTRRLAAISTAHRLAGTSIEAVRRAQQGQPGAADKIVGVVFGQNPPEIAYWERGE